MRTSLDIQVSSTINRETGEVTEVATLNNTGRIIGLTYTETSTGFIPGGTWQGEHLEQKRAQALAWTFAQVSEDGAWTIPGAASDADKARILVILNHLDRDEVLAARAEAQTRAKRVREQLRKIADGEVVAPAFRSKYHASMSAQACTIPACPDHHGGDVDTAGHVVDAQTDRMVSDLLGL